MAATFIDTKGEQHEAKLSPSLYKEALANNMTVPQLINRKYETHPDADSSTFEQLCASEGLIKNTDKEFGLRSPTLAQVFDGSTELNAGLVTNDANPASRILFPAVILEMIESTLATDRTTDVVAFDEMVAYDTAVTSNRIERPVVDMSVPESGVSMPVAQGAEPSNMMSFTVSDKSYSLPNYALGIKFTDEALRANTLDFVSMSIARQAEVERNSRVYTYLTNFLNGDKDVGNDSALTQVKANTLDTSIAAAGELTHKAWVKFLFRNKMQRTITHVVTDLDSYLAIEGRTGRPVSVGDTLGSDVSDNRLNSIPIIFNRTLGNVRVFIVEDGKGWPANTIMGIDAGSGIHRIRNSAAAYSAVERFALRKSSALRFDFSEIAFRQYDVGFDVLSLTL